MNKMLFVYNPHSGKGAISQYLSDILSVFTVSGYDVTVHPTCAALDGQQYIASHAGEYSVVVSSGGDGMLHELFCGMLEGKHNMPCGYIPSGTVNDFASSLEIPRNPVEAAKEIVKGKYSLVDAGLFGDKVFSYVAAFGMFTKVSYSTNQQVKNALGSAAYLLEILRTMDIISFYKSNVRATIVANGKEYEDDYIFGVVGNTFSVGGFANLVPNDASMTDGLLDCMFIKTPKTIPELERIKISLINQDYNTPGILTFKTDKISVRTATPLRWTLDGEDGGETHNIDIGIIHEAIKIAVPQ